MTNKVRHFHGVKQQRKANKNESPVAREKTHQKKENHRTNESQHHHQHQPIEKPMCACVLVCYHRSIFLMLLRKNHK